MSAVAVGVGLLGAWSGNQSRRAAEEAAKRQQAGGNLALAENRRQFEIGQNNLAPWLGAGRRALTAQQDLMGLGKNGAEGSLAALMSAPGYQFRLQQGQKNLDSGLASRGGMGGGKSMKAGVDYNQGFASNEYGNRLSQLSSLSGMGRSTAGDMASLGSQFGQNQGNIYMGNANAQGAARIAGSNAMQSGILGGIQAGIGAYGAMNPTTPTTNNLNQSTLGNTTGQGMPNTGSPTNPNWWNQPTF